MTTENSLQLIDDAINILESDAFSFLRHLSDSISAFKNQTEKSLLNDGNASIAGTSYSKNIKNQINGALAQASTYEMSRHIHQIEAKLEAGTSVIPENLVLQLREYIASIVSFIRNIETYRFANANNIQEMYESIVNVELQKTYLLGYRGGVKLLQTHIIDAAEVTEGNTNIELTFYSDENSFQAFTQLAIMIDAVYIEIGQILDKAPKSNALLVRMIHTGSFHFSLVGDQKILALFETILKNSGKYFYENYTKSGEFQKLSGNLADLITKLQLLAPLEALGINISEAKEQLEKSLTLIARAINENLRHQYKINVNSAEVLIYPPQAAALPKFEPKLISYRGFDETA